MLSASSIGLIAMGCVFVVCLVAFLCVVINLKKKIAAQKGNLDTEKNALELELSKTLESKDALIQILNNNISSLENKIKDAEDEKSRILQEKNQDEEKISTVLPSDNAGVLKEFQEKNAKLKELNDGLENKVKELNADVKNSKLDISSLTAQLKSFQEKTCESVAEFERISGELEKVKETNVDLTKNLEKTKKENKTLKDENEDLENDIENLENKIKKNKDEISSLKDDLESLNKKNKNQSERIGELSEELNGAKASLSNKQKALTFVQEILTAKENPDNTTKERRKVINRINSFMNDSLFDLMKASDGTVAEIENLKNEFDVWQNLEKKHWLRNKRAIAFVGEFSAGKTSIVNSILKQNDPKATLLPESVKATTAIPTYISNTSGRSSFAFLTPNNQLKTMSETTFKMVDKEVLENVKGTSSLIKYFVMSYNNKALNDLSILDTPGFDSNDPEDAMRTIEIINECDALFWVVDVNKGELNKTSIKTIKENLRRPLFVVINKIDSVNPSGLEDADKKIRKTLDDNGIAYEKIIRFSKKANASLILEYLNSVSKARVEVNAIKTLEKVVDSYRQKAHDEVEKSKGVLARAKSDGNEAMRIFSQTVDELKRACDDVAEMPSRKEHGLIWKETVFEMTPSGFSEFKEKLELVKEISKRSEVISNARTEFEQEIVKSVDDCQKAVQLEMKWEKLSDTFRKIVASFNSTVANC